MTQPTQYSNTSTLMTLVVGVDAVSAQITVNDASGLPIAFPYNLAIDADTSAVEIVQVTATAGNVLTVNRGTQDTSAKPHSVGAQVYLAWTAGDGWQIQDHIFGSSGVHGLTAGSDVVGTTDTQTLTNKTMSGLDNTFTDLPASAITGSFATLNVTGTINAGDNVSVTRPAAGSWSFVTRVTGDADPRFVIEAGGTQRWGDGVARDVNLYRSAPDTLRTDDSFQAGGSLTVTGPTTLNTTSVTQSSPGSVALLVTANASATNEAVRVVADEGAVGLVVRRNSSTTTGSPLMAWMSETGSTLGAYERDGTLALNQPVAGTAALNVTPHTAPTSPSALFVGGVGAPAVSVRRNNATATGNLQEWATESNSVMGFFSRAGLFQAQSGFINGSLSVVGTLNVDGVPVPKIQTGQVAVSFTSSTSTFVDVTFPEVFDTAPMVFGNIASGAGQTAGWWIRCGNSTTSNFRIFLNGGSAVTWSAIPVMWLAVGT